MAFSTNLDSLVTNMDESAFLLKSIARAVQDHGGGVDHANRLLRDARGDRRIINALAKQLVGRVWELVEQPIDLGEIDFEAPLHELKEMYEGVRLKRLVLEQLFEDYREPPAPKRHCSHKLFYPGLDRGGIKEVLKTLPSGCEFAGFREALAYADRLQKGDLSGLGILAAGRNPKTDYVTLVSNEHVSGATVELLHTQFLSVTRSLFLLVRVYD